MKIFRDKNLEDKIYDKLTRWLTDTQRLEEIHISDIEAPMLAVMQRLYGPRITRREAGYFTAGRAHHDIIECLVTTNIMKHEVPVTYDGIVGTIDVIGDNVVEIKTTRSMYIKEEIPEHYIRRLGYYVATYHKKLNKAKGKLILFYISPKGEYPIMIAHSITFNNLNEIRKEMVDKKNKILSVLNGEADITVLDRCEEWRCKECLYSRECGQ